jgi:predicted Fe-S protein YdhL (DUF1289 family)
MSRSILQKTLHERHMWLSFHQEVIENVISRLKEHAKRVKRRGCDSILYQMSQKDITRLRSKKYLM